MVDQEKQCGCCRREGMAGGSSTRRDEGGYYQHTLRLATARPTKEISKGTTSACADLFRPEGTSWPKKFREAKLFLQRSLNAQNPRFDDMMRSLLDRTTATSPRKVKETATPQAVYGTSAAGFLSRDARRRRFSPRACPRASRRRLRRGACRRAA